MRRTRPVARTAATASALQVVVESSDPAVGRPPRGSPYSRLVRAVSLRIAIRVTLADFSRFRPGLLIDLLANGKERPDEARGLETP